MADTEPTEPTPRRRPGRPGPEDAPRDVRQDLLDVAGRLFAERGPAEVSVRELAAAADVTPAMVHYYFGDKQGLYDALLESAFSSMLERVQRIAAEPDPEAGGLSGLLREVVSTFAARPWLPNLVLREVVADEGRFRERFIDLYASKMPALIGSVLRKDPLPFRSELDPRFMFMSLLGMTAWPFAARPIVERVFGLEYDDAFAKAFAEHTRRLFLDGVHAREDA